MPRLNDKYGRGSAAANGAEFVDLEPGDTFSGLEAKIPLQDGLAKTIEYFWNKK